MDPRCDVVLEVAMRSGRAPPEVMRGTRFSRARANRPGPRSAVDEHLLIGAEIGCGRLPVESQLCSATRSSWSRR